MLSFSEGRATASSSISDPWLLKTENGDAELAAMPLSSMTSSGVLQRLLDASENIAASLCFPAVL